jgi:hypothetical protein
LEYLWTGNSYHLLISLLVVCPLELIVNESFSKKIKKESSPGLNGLSEVFQQLLGGFSIYPKLRVTFIVYKKAF